MPSQVTFTGQLGAGVTVTSKVFTNIIRLDLDIARGVAGIYQQMSATEPPAVTWVSISASATLTDTIASGNHTIVIST